VTSPRCAGSSSRNATSWGASRGASSRSSTSRSRIASATSADHLVRIVDEAMFFQDRVTSLLDANLATVSNNLNSIMKILTVIATVFMPLTLITGLYGMNVDLPHFGMSGFTMFGILMGIMTAITVGMLAYFRRSGWI
jgi:magnesium transporter